MIDWEHEEEVEALKCLKLLLDHGARVNCANADGKTPLHFTSYLPPAFALQLIEKGGTCPVDVMTFRVSSDCLLFLFH